MLHQYWCRKMVLQNWCNRELEGSGGETHSTRLGPASAISIYEFEGTPADDGWVTLRGVQVQRIHDP